MRILVLGATGHVGGYLVPRLVRAGHDVVALSRGRSGLYREDPAWDRVERVVADRDAEEAAGRFGDRVRALEPDAVVDMVCFTEASARTLLDAIRGRDVFLAMCGTIWTHGVLTEVPARETDPRRPWGDYGVRKLAIERLVLADPEVRATVIHPGHISGPGWSVINPQANLDPAVWERLAAGEPLALPDHGLQTVHHVHADDVAQLFERALGAQDAAAGRSFHAVSERSLTLRGFAEAVAGWWDREARLEFLPFADFRATTSPEHAQTTWEHAARSHTMSIAAAQDVLGYAPAFTSLAAVREAVDALAAAGSIRVPPLNAAPQ